MRQFFGMSQSGDLTEAVSGLDNPQFIKIGRSSCRERVFILV